METPRPVIINIRNLTLTISDFETDLEALERFLESIGSNIGSWLDYERDQQRCCPRCDTNHRLYERHDSDRCPYCHRIIDLPRSVAPQAEDQ